jgi:hypothetical protein
MKSQLLSSYLSCLLLVLALQQATVDARVKGVSRERALGGKGGKAVKEDVLEGRTGTVTEEKVKEVKVKEVKVKDAKEETVKEDKVKEGNDKVEKVDGKEGGKKGILIDAEEAEDREDTVYVFDEDGNSLYIVVDGDGDESFNFQDSAVWDRLDPVSNNTTLDVGNSSTTDVILQDEAGDFIGISRVGDNETNGQLPVNGTLNITNSSNSSFVATSNELEARVLELELQMDAMVQLSEKVWMLELEVGKAKQTIANHERLITSLAMAVAPFTPVTIEEEEPLHVTWLMSKEFSREGAEP